MQVADPYRKLKAQANGGVSTAVAPSNGAAAKLPLDLEEAPLPLNTYSNKAPFTGKVVSVERIVGPNATGETCNIVISHGGDMPYWEGQSYGVIPPGKEVLGARFQAMPCPDRSPSSDASRWPKQKAKRGAVYPFLASAVSRRKPKEARKAKQRSSVLDRLVPLRRLF